MPNKTIVSVDLHNAETEGRKAFNDSLRDSGWSRYAEYNNGEKRRLPFTVWLTELTTGLAITNALDRAISDGNQAQNTKMSIRRAVASPYSKTVFISPANEKQPISEALTEILVSTKG